MSIEKKVGPITINCIAPDARDLLDRLVKSYTDFFGIEPCEDTKHSPYSVLYWACRYSGLIQGVESPEKILTVSQEQTKKENP